MQPRTVPPASGTLGGTVGVSAAAGLFRAAAGFAAGVVVARALGPAGRGQFAFVTASVAMAVVLSNIGVTNGLVQARAKRGRTVPQLYAAATTLGVLVGTAASLAFLLLYVTLGGSVFAGVALSSALWITVLVPPILTLQHWTAVGYIAGRVREYALANSAGTVLFLLAVTVVGLAGQLTLPTTITLWSISALVPLIVIVRELRRASWADGIRTAKDVLRFGMRVNAATLFQALAWRLDVFLVQAFRGPAELGYYAVAVSLAEGLLVFGTAVRSSLTPAQSAAERAELPQLLARTTRLLTAVGLAACLATFLVGGLIVRFLFGAEFIAAVPALYWLVPGVATLVVQGPLLDYLVTEGHVAVATVAGALAFSVNLGIDLALLSRTSFVIAATGSTLAYALGTAVVLTAFGQVTGTGWRELLILRRSDLAVLRSPG